MTILARLAFGAPVQLDQVPYEGIEEVTPDDLAYAKELGLSLKLLGVAERLEDEISVRVFPCFLYPGHPLAPVEGPFNAVTVEAPVITEITMSGPGAGGAETASAVLGRRRLGPLRRLAAVRGELQARRSPRTRPRPSTSTSRWRTGPACWRKVAEILGDNEVSVRSVVQRGLGDDARLEMVMHEGPESRFDAALEKIAKLKFLRSPPRSIRVIEEEFV